MLGFRGASRYIARVFRDCFELECAAMRKVRDELGLTNVELMVPFVRTLRRSASRCSRCSRRTAGARQERPAHRDDVRAARPTRSSPTSSSSIFDGFSIGSNDLTQLTLGLDRDSGLVAEALRRARPGGEGACSHMAIRACRKAGQVRRHLRPGPVRPSRPRALADGAGHREPVAQSRYGGVDLDGAGRGAAAADASKSQRLRSSRCFSRFHSFSRSSARLSCLSLPGRAPISSLMRPLL